MSLRIHTVREVLGVVIPIVKQHVEYRPLKCFLHLALITRDHPCGTQKSRVVHCRRNPEVRVQKTRQRMDRDALPLRQIKAFNAEGRLLLTQIEHPVAGTSKPQALASWA